MVSPGNSYSIALFSNLLKTVYRGEIEPLKNFKNPLLKKIKIEDGFVGSDFQFARLTTYQGGYSVGPTLPRTEISNVIRPQLKRKRLYAQVKLEREIMAAAMSDEGAFKRLADQAKFDLQNSVEQCLSLNLFLGDSSNNIVLGTISGSPTGSGTAGSPYVCTLTSANQVEFKFHINQLVNVASSTDEFKVVNLDPVAGTVSLQIITGSSVPANTNTISLHGSAGNSFTGIPFATASSGTLYNVTIGLSNQWLATVVDNAAASLTLPLLYEMLARVERRSGEQPDMIVCGFEQYLKIASLLENKRVELVPNRAAMKHAADDMGHSALAIMSNQGPVEIFWDRMMDSDKVYFLNSNKMTLYKAPLSGLVEAANGSLLHPLHVAAEDSYLMIYACYGDFFLEPTFMGVLKNLSLDTE